MIDNKLMSLVQPFQNKAKVFLQVVRKRYNNLGVFETRRDLARQKWLYQNGKSWTLKSKHLTGQAVDRIFFDKYNNPTWRGDYKYLQYVGVMCGMTTIPKEQCHLQDDGRSIENVMKTNSERRKKTTSASDRKLLSEVNDAFRRYGYK